MILRRTLFTPDSIDTLFLMHFYISDFISWCLLTLFILIIFLKIFKMNFCNFFP